MDPLNVTLPENLREQGWEDRAHRIGDERRAKALARKLGHKYPHVEYAAYRVGDGWPIAYTIIYRPKVGR